MTESLEIFVGYCGTSTLANFMHHMKKTYTDILYPMGAECFHSLETNRLTFKIPPYNSVGEMIVEKYSKLQGCQAKFLRSHFRALHTERRNRILSVWDLMARKVIQEQPIQDK